MRLGNNECVLALATKDEEFDGLFLGAFGLAVVCNHQRTLRRLGLSSEDLLSALWVVQIIKVQANDIFKIIGSLVGLLGFSVVLLRLLGFGDHHED